MAMELSWNLNTNNDGDCQEAVKYSLTFIETVIFACIFVVAD